jgi:hypothetical protein
MCIVSPSRNTLDFEHCYERETASAPFHDKPAYFLLSSEKEIVGPVDDGTPNVTCARGCLDFDWRSVA